MRATRRSFLKKSAQVGTAAALLTPAVEAALASRADAAIPDKTKFKVGWTVFDHQATTEAHIDGIRRQKPTMVRWAVAWDKFESPYARFRDWSQFETFFKAVAELKSRLVVTISVFDALWLGPWGQGVAWAKPDFFANWPANVDESFGSFVRSLFAAAKAAGVNDISIGPWNEPDLLWGAWDTTTNPTYEWRILSRPGHAFWTGGTGPRWAQMFSVLDQVAPGTPFNSAGIASTECQQRAGWARATGVLPQLAEIDLHIYAWNKDLATFMTWVANALAVWDASTPKPLPFFIGECNDDSEPPLPDVPTAETEARMRERHAALAKAYPTRYRGMAMLGNCNWKSTRGWWDDGSTTPPPRPVLQWWEYLDPRNWWLLFT